HTALSAARPPPASTPFPYTTLFRSELHAAGHTVIIVTHDLSVAETCDRLIEISDGRIIADRRRPAASAKPIVEPEPATPARAWRDRKSTRLNSSHVKISYAVFCLKK